MQASSARSIAAFMSATSALCKPTRAAVSLRCRRPASLPLLFLSVALLSASPALAQPTFRDLTGTVSDRHHEPLRGAVVQVHNDTTQGVLSYITGRDGSYSFKRLDGATDYQVSATYRDHHSRTRKLTRFDSKRAKKINLVIRLQ